MAALTSIHTIDHVMTPIFGYVGQGDMGNVSRYYRQKTSQVEKRVLDGFRHEVMKMPRYLWPAIQEHFFTAVMGESPDMSQNELLKRNFRLHLGNEATRQIVSGALDVKEVLQSFREQYDWSLVTLHGGLADGERDRLPLEDLGESMREKAEAVRKCLSDHSGTKEGGTAAGVRMLNLHRDVSIIPHEIAHFTGLQVLKAFGCSHIRYPSTLKLLKELHSVDHGCHVINPLSRDETYGFVSQGNYRGLGHVPYRLLIGSHTLSDEALARAMRWHVPESELDRLRLEQVEKQRDLAGAFSEIVSLLPGIGKCDRMNDKQLDQFCYHLWDIAGRPADKRGDWGERNLFKWRDHRIEAVHRLRFDMLPEVEKKAVDFWVWRNDGGPAGDPLYGMHHRYDDYSLKLFDAMEAASGSFGTRISLSDILKSFNCLPNAFKERIVGEVTRSGGFVSEDEDIELLFASNMRGTSQCIDKYVPTHFALFQIFNHYYPENREGFSEEVRNHFDPLIESGSFTDTSIIAKTYEEFQAIIHSPMFAALSTQFITSLCARAGIPLNEEVRGYISFIKENIHNSSHLPSEIDRAPFPDRTKEVLHSFTPELLFMMIKAFPAA